MEPQGLQTTSHQYTGIIYPNKNQRSIPHYMYSVGNTSRCKFARY